MKYAQTSARTVRNVKTRDYHIPIRAQFSLFFGRELSEWSWYPHWRMQENRLGTILSSKIIQQRLLLGMIILNSQTSYLIAKMNIWIKTLEFTLWSINNGAKLQLPGIWYSIYLMCSDLNSEVLKFSDGKGCCFLFNHF